MNRWRILFGSPEDAANTIYEKGLLPSLLGLDWCDTCPSHSDRCYGPAGKCAMISVEAILKWLEEDPDKDDALCR